MLDGKTTPCSVVRSPPLAEGPPETLQEALSHYELTFMPSRNFSQKTRVNYRTDVLDLIEFLAGRGKRRLDQLSQRDLEEYLADLKTTSIYAQLRRRR